MKFLKGERGLAMPLVLMVLVVLSLLATALWQYSISELNQSVREEKRTRAYYVARAGAESLARHIMVNPEVLSSISEETGIATPGITFDDGADEVIEGDLEVILQRVDANSVEVIGTATVDGISQTVSILLETSEGFDGVVYAASDLNFQNGVTVIGDLVTGGVVKFGGTEVPAENYSNHPNVTGNIKTNVSIVFPPPEFPVVPTEYFSSNLSVDSSTPPITDSPEYAYRKISIANKKDAFLTIDASANDVYLRTDDFEISQNSGGLILNTSANHKLVVVVDTIILRNVLVTGDGVAELYVYNAANIQTTSGYIDPDSTARLDVFLGEGAELAMIANAFFDGLVYGPQAFVSTNGNAKFAGSMIVKELKGTGGSSIGSAQTTFTNKYSWDLLGSVYGGYLMVHWVQ